MSTYGRGINAYDREEIVECEGVLYELDEHREEQEIDCGFEGLVDVIYEEGQTYWQCPKCKRETFGHAD